jgi:predicted dehydrogenase
MWSRRLLSVSAKAVGDQGEIRITNFVAPQLFNRLTVRTGAGRWSERVAGEPTYNYQLRAFAAAVRDGADVLTPPSDAVANMRVIDDCYLAAGLQPRGLP